MGEEESRGIIKLVGDYMRGGQMGGKRVRSAKEIRAAEYWKIRQCGFFLKIYSKEVMRATRWRLSGMLR